MYTILVSKKLFITFFLIMIGLAFYVSCLNFYERTKFSPKKTIRHYSGNEKSFSDEPEEEYSEELLQEGFFFPKSYREIIEITHVHSYMITLIVFVLSRIFSMTKVREIFKIIIYTFAFVGTILNLSGPWLIRYKSDIFTISLIASYVILGVCFIFYISLPIYEMWFRKSEEKDISYWL
ncbi:MAG: hypothetical protein V3V70_09045 [Candidatus Scalindua sp.]